MGRWLHQLSIQSGLQAGGMCQSSLQESGFLTLFSGLFMHFILTSNRIKSEIFLGAGPGTGLQDFQASHAFPVFVDEGPNSLLAVMLCLLYLRLLKMKRKLSTDLPFNRQVFSARLVDKDPR